MIYDERSIEDLYKQNLDKACKLLATLPVAEGREQKIKGLSGWVFQQTIRYCLSRELRSLGLSPEFREEVPLVNKAKVDLLVGGVVAIEIKSRGGFNKGYTEKYKRYKAEAEKRGWVYFYLTGSESYEPYRKEAISTFGEDRAFFLDKKGDWARFINEIVKILCSVENN